jgi:hypothetical protein
VSNSPAPKRAIDEPLTLPGGDLLDMDQHAKALADYVRQDRKLPFTIGIFGEWGEGKTTMVNFLKHHLTPPEVYGPPTPFNFVSFSAWPYTTSDTLWRALIMEIARVLYRVEKTEDQPPDSVNGNERSDWMTRVSDFLRGELFRRPPEEPDRFEKLMRELDRTDYGKISKRTPSATLDQEAMMSAVVDGALTVLGTVSPLVAGMRSFIGLGPKKKTEQSGESGDDAVNEDAALPRFQKIFRDLLADKPGKDPVYVFIDDLDRAQPDVALDIMESIRIALSQGDCVYILAVDQRLIAQGLRLRYRELFAKAEELDVEAKGKEYLEKIIQFTTRVPPRTREQTQRLIAAEFPHLTAAGDIIQGIVGNNPRRVKQYCQRLTFQRMIGAATFTIGSAPEPNNEPAPAHTPMTETKGSEVLALSRQLRYPEFNEQEIQELFLQLGEKYAQYEGNPYERVQTLLATYQNDGRIELVKEAVEIIKPGYLSPRT